ncbi:MAG: hypothetical protein JKY49_00380 [Cohaesibacteraceae bacterium]|nr:hypothetical protein [Cohaesibacteraceae bacterium]MBL4875754.1 hypothetical protein [Cohaesibacteraceae bacterium]
MPKFKVIYGTCYAGTDTEEVLEFEHLDDAEEYAYECAVNLLSYGASETDEPLDSEEENEEK